MKILMLNSVVYDHGFADVTPYTPVRWHQNLLRNIACALSGKLNNQYLPWTICQSQQLELHSPFRQ